MTKTAYDTAWLARLKELGEPIGEKALQWLRENQLSDGSWGTESPCYYHDRVICTLAAMSALARCGNGTDSERIRRAWPSLSDFTKKLKTDLAGATVGFEMIVPTLLEEVKQIDAIKIERDYQVLKELIPYRSAKLAALPGETINRNFTVAHSVEMAGPDGLHLIDTENLQEKNGSVGNSPSATAYFVRYVEPNNRSACSYLHRISEEGAAPNVVPFDVFEQAWTLWNLSLLIEDLDQEILALCSPHLDFLKNAWQAGVGVGFAADYTPNDGDDTSLTYETLKRYGRSVDIDAVLQYEYIYYFRCFQFESTPSISTNIHVLGALRHAGFNPTDPSVEKVLNFLNKVRAHGAYWYDKWHISPYYATSHAIVAAAGYVDKLITDAIEWVISTQNDDGSWGYYLPTAEETAYALQSLAIYKRFGHQVPETVIEKGYVWLKNHRIAPYPPLWIGKCLYCPQLVVRAAVLSALYLTEDQ
jgi:halimadienyl-diphosphate synthase